MHYVFEVKICTPIGHAVQRITAPSAGHVIAMLAEEDANDLAQPEITSVSVTRVQL